MQKGNRQDINLETFFSLASFLFFCVFTIDLGWYLYITSSGQHHVNDTARLSSIPVTGGITRCLSFWYYMYGPHVNTINVYTRIGSTYGNPVWHHAGTADNNWHQAVFTLRVTSTYIIVFEAVRGNSYAGDMAIDDISVKDGDCGKW